MYGVYGGLDLISRAHPKSHIFISFRASISKFSGLSCVVWCAILICRRIHLLFRTLFEEWMIALVSWNFSDLLFGMTVWVVIAFYAYLYACVITYTHTYAHVHSTSCATCARVATQTILHSQYAECDYSQQRILRDSLLKGGYKRQTDLNGPYFVGRREICITRHCACSVCRLNISMNASHKKIVLLSK
jgi:hypothetical protein